MFTIQMSPLSTITVLNVSSTSLLKFPPFSSSVKPRQLSISACLSSERLPSVSTTNPSSTPLTSDCLTESSRNGPAIVNHNKILTKKIGATSIEEDDSDVAVSRSIKENIEFIRSMLGSIEDGDITVSAYDTAWVALVENINGNDGPQFPSSLEWIANNQLTDGSWGDKDIFSAYDRLMSTLACVIALRTWNVHPDKSQKGIEFFSQNFDRLEVDNVEHMPSGFEVAFPSLIEIAKKLEIDGLPNNSPILQDICARRNLKLSRIPKDIMQSMPTALLYSLEGMSGLDWEKLLKLQCDNGSFLFSPSSTAYALMQTKDHKCLIYLSKIVQKFGGGVPTVYPIDLFEHIWVVDRLERLGISRYFKYEIKECMGYVNKYWTDSGIAWTRNSRVHDIDDTAMAFRLLRLHGYCVSPNVFKHFEEKGEFFTFAGQSNRGITENVSLYRASQLMFPGEEILARAKEFSSNVLIEKRAKNELADKWIITKDLLGEVGYALDIPWYSSLPRLETRFYLEQYGAENDAWIAKTMYRLKLVSNNIYLDLAKNDYNQTQSLHQREWKSIQKWYTECDLVEFGLSKRRLLLAYYLATTNIFEAERSTERLAWAKTSALIEIFMSCSAQEQISREEKIYLVHQFELGINIGYTNLCWNNTTYEKIIKILFETLNQLSLDFPLDHGRYINQCLCEAWFTWLILWEEGDDKCGQEEAKLLVHTLNLSSGRWVSDDLLLSSPKYVQLFEISSNICHQLRLLRHKMKEEKDSGNENMKGILCGIDIGMQQLVKLVLLEPSDNLEADTKETFLAVVKSFYYAAWCDPETIDEHITKVLFDEVL